MSYDPKQNRQDQNKNPGQGQGQNQNKGQGQGQGGRETGQGGRYDQDEQSNTQKPTRK